MPKITHRSLLHFGLIIVGVTVISVWLRTPRLPSGMKYENGNPVLSSFRLISKNPNRNNPPDFTVCYSFSQNHISVVFLFTLSVFFLQKEKLAGVQWRAPTQGPVRGSNRQGPGQYCCTTYLYAYTCHNIYLYVACVHISPHCRMVSASVGNVTATLRLEGNYSRMWIRIYL